MRCATRGGTRSDGTSRPWMDPAPRAVVVAPPPTRSGGTAASPRTATSCRSGTTTPRQAPCGTPGGTPSDGTSRSWMDPALPAATAARATMSASTARSHSMAAFPTSGISIPMGSHCGTGGGTVAPGASRRSTASPPRTAATPRITWVSSTRSRR